MISYHSEGTFGRLRYILGGDHPSQTAYLTLPPDRINGRGLEWPHNKGSIPVTPPPRLASRFHWLLPILYESCRHSIASYSKAPWGLSVRSRGSCIFPGTIGARRRPWRPEAIRSTC